MQVKRKAWRSFLCFLGIGIVAVLFLYPMLLEQISAQLDELGVSIGLPLELLAVLSLINPLLFIIIGLTIGHFLAEKTGFSSIVYERDRYGKPFISRFKAILPSAIGFGVLAGITILVVDFLLLPYLPKELGASSDEMSISFIDLGTRFLYGGVAEELMLRFGVMTLLVFLMWKIFQRRKTKPSPAIVWIGIILSALLFGLGHYGATAALTEMTPIIFLRMIFLNGFGGLIFGWLYWRKGLEAAMIAHIFTHVVFVFVSLLRSFI
ncbi:CPBP family intramembrane glutamic endopeptidase [Alkalihalobacillus sp. FSL R5-0424]